MDENTIARLQSNIRSRSGPELLRALSDTIGGHAGGSLEGYHLVTVVQRAKAGEPQVIGDAPSDQIVVISMTDLAALFEAAADMLSFADALKRVGFEPVTGGDKLRLVRRRRHERNLRVYGTEKGSK